MRDSLGGATHIEMTKRAYKIGLLILALGLAAGFAVAWQYWSPFLRYRERRLRAEYNSEIRRYLSGSDSLGVAAHRLAQVTLEIESIIARQPSPAAEAGSMTITALDDPDIPQNDPRVDELVLNAFKLANPPGVPEAFRQMWDSIIRSRGYRSVP
jgi:hypothetical protein